MYYRTTSVQDFAIRNSKRF